MLESCLIVASSHKIQEYRYFFTAKVTETYQGSLNTLATLSSTKLKKEKRKKKTKWEVHWWKNLFCIKLALRKDRNSNFIS